MEKGAKRLNKVVKELGLPLYLIRGQTHWRLLQRLLERCIENKMQPHIVTISHSALQERLFLLILLCSIYLFIDQLTGRPTYLPTYVRIRDNSAQSQNCTWDRLLISQSHDPIDPHMVSNLGVLEVKKLEYHSCKWLSEKNWNLRSLTNRKPLLLVNNCWTLVDQSSLHFRCPAWHSVGSHIKQLHGSVSWILLKVSGATRMSTQSLQKLLWEGTQHIQWAEWPDTRRTALLILWISCVIRWGSENLIVSVHEL